MGDAEGRPKTKQGGSASWDVMGHPVHTSPNPIPKPDFNLSENQSGTSKFLKTALCQLTAGGTAGLVEVSLMHPLDLVKTRFQVQGSDPTIEPYKSVTDCFRRMIAAEGIFAMYKGILPPILADTPKRATKFFGFEQFKILFSEDEKNPGFFALWMAGLFTGLTEAFVVNPFEVAKVKLQTETGTSLHDQKSAWSTVKDIVRTDGFGLRGLNKGLTATLYRHGIFNMIYFGFYYNVKDSFPPFQDSTQEFCRKFLIGFTSGTLGSIANIPFDNVKSRIQGPQPEEGVVKYKYCHATLVTLYKEEGLASLYRGLVPKVMRLGPGGGIMLLVYEYAFNYLSDRFLKD